MLDDAAEQQFIKTVKADVERERARDNAKARERLRDEFAMRAMQGMVSTIDSEECYLRMAEHAAKQGKRVSEWIAVEAYKQADAMLAERVK